MPSNSRRAVLSGVVRPDVDESALDRNVKRKVQRGLSEATEEGLSTGIDAATNTIQRKFERAIPGGAVLGSVFDAVRGGGGGAGGGAAGGGGGSGNLLVVQQAQLEKLDDIHDELERMGAGQTATGRTTAALGVGKLASLGTIAQLTAGVGAGVAGLGLATSAGFFGKELEKRGGPLAVSGAQGLASLVPGIGPILQSSIAGGALAQRQQQPTPGPFESFFTGLLEDFTGVVGGGGGGGPDGGGPPSGGGSNKAKDRKVTQSNEFNIETRVEGAFTLADLERRLEQQKQEILSEISASFGAGGNSINTGAGGAFGFEQI